MADLQKNFKTIEHNASEMTRLNEEKIPLDRFHFIANWYQQSSSYLLQTQIIDQEEELEEETA